MTQIAEFVDSINDFILDHSTLWWVLPVVFLLCFIDGIIPPLPSDTVVVALAAVAVTTGEPNLMLLGATAAAGAFVGDQTAYAIGRHSPIERLTRSRYKKIRATMGWADRQLRRRGGVIIIAGRYLPVGRIAVNLTAGATKYPRWRFIQFDAVAAVSWSIYCVLMGVFAGEMFNRIAPGDNGPLLSAAFAIALAGITGYFVDRFLQRKTGAPGPEVGRFEKTTDTDEQLDVSGASEPEESGGPRSSEVAMAGEVGVLQQSDPAADGDELPGDPPEVRS